MSVAFLIFAAAAVPPGDSDSLAIKALHDFGACIVEESPKGAPEQLLAMDFRTEDYRKKLRAMTKGHDRCLVPNWKLRTNGSLLIAGAMAEALLKAEVKPAELPQRLAYDPARPAIPARSQIETMALCTVLKAPQPTSQLLEAEPASKDETAAMAPIGPVLGECLKKEMKVSLNPPAVRALLALAAWRIASTPKAAS